jgi:alkanesulfonate monooxygenase SsuD/methylene tetrahydromethanopterin reductase-like flavin-dependent oxidoreductase (luciferase family)
MCARLTRVRLGIFVVPDATDPGATLRQVEAAERSGLDLVGIQDHPYQRRFFDTWTLLAYLAGRTSRIGLLPDVVNLPLRLPSVLAKSAASLDVLSGGRVELGIGAGAFWEAVEAMGGPRRTPGESVDALEEAIAIIRGFWSAERSVSVDGRHYQVHGAKPGPPPAHSIPLHIGAYGPRMLRLTGRLGDGWLPSLGDHYLPAERALDCHAVIDVAAERAGRDPSAIERAANVMDAGDARAMADGLARIVTELRFETVLVSVPGDDPVGFVERLGAEVGPRVRQLIG